MTNFFHFVERPCSKELHAVSKDNFFNFSSSNPYVRLFDKVAESLPEKVKEIVAYAVADKAELSGDDICHAIAEAKKAKDKGEISEPQFNEAKTKLKAQLRAWLPQGYYPGGVREKGAAILPTGLAMLDLDHLKMSPREMYVQVKDTLTKLSLWHLVALAHMTPSCEGLRLVFAIPYGMQTPEEAQRWLTTLLDVDYDRSCKDLARLSFVAPENYYFHHDLNLLFADHTDPEKRPRVHDADYYLQLLGRQPATQAAPQHQTRTSEPSPTSAQIASAIAPAQSAPAYAESESADAIYRKVIDEWLRIELNGRQAPVKGERNTVVNKLGADLRKYFRLSLDKMMHLVDGWGLSDSEKRSALESGMSYESDPYSETMRQAVKAARGETDCLSTLGHLYPIYAETPPQMPAKLPRLVATLTDGFSDDNRPAIAMAVFPALAAHLKNVDFVYRIDNNISVHHAVMMHVLVGTTGSGKSCVDPVLQTIIADIDEADRAGWAQEEAWRVEKSKVSKNAKQPERPKAVIRHISSNITPAKISNLAQAADGYMLYNSVTEIDGLFKMANTRQELYEMLRVNTDLKAFVAQFRQSADSEMNKTKPELCISASTTPGMCHNFFDSELLKGCTTRHSFSLLPEQENGARVANSGNLRGLRDRIRPYIDSLNACHDTVVAPSRADVVDDTLEGMPVVECLQLGEYSQSVYEHYRTLAGDTDDAAVDNFSRRAALQGYLRACVLYVANGMKWEDEIGEFARWTVDHDMWCKYRLFGRQFNEAKEAETRMLNAPRTLSPSQKSALVFAKLPVEVTAESVLGGYAMAGQPQPKDINALLRQWVKRGKIAHTEVPGVYRKLPKTPKKRQVK